jgi:cystathionine beta-lyase/cystathionine gamma-synthase
VIDKKCGFETQLVHAGEPPQVDRSVTLPIFQTSTFRYEGEGNYHDIRYQRLNNNPNQLAVSDKLAVIEGAEKGVSMASGMAAISTTLLALVGAGGELLSQEDLYGGSRYFFDGQFKDFGRTTQYFSLDCVDKLAEKITPKTRAIYMESISNPTMRVADLVKVARLANDRGILAIIDNTLCSPFNFRPIEIGFDVVLHSATKYLNGHSDIVAGAVVGSEKNMRRVLETLNLLGGCLDPHACFLLQRGMKTLGLRVARQNETALALAKDLQKHPRVRQVNYPGLPESFGHSTARELFRGFGGMLSFVLDTDSAGTEAFFSRLTIPAKAPSLGGVESLVTRPAMTSHCGLSQKERDSQGIVDSLVRVSVGIEDFDDLARDFRQALEPI